MHRYRLWLLAGMAFAALIVLLAVFPLFAGAYPVKLLQEILIWGIFAMSLDLLMGYAGMVSFGHSAFFGLGMYGAAAALLTVSPPNLWLALLYASAGVVLCITIIGIPFGVQCFKLAVFSLGTLAAVLGYATFF